MSQLTAEQLEQRRCKQRIRRIEEMKKQIVAVVNHQPMGDAREVLRVVLRAVAHQWESSSGDYFWANDPALKHFYL